VVDVNAMLITLFNANANPVRTALTNPNTFGQMLPEGFDVRGGAKAVVIGTRGGDAHPEIKGWVTERVQITAWALISLDARKVYGAVYDYLHGLQALDCGGNGFLVTALEVVSGQDVVDPDTGWATCVGFFNVTVRP
jgi:hypothetical protein